MDSSLDAPLVVDAVPPARTHGSAWFVTLAPIVLGIALRFGFAAIAPLAPQWDGVIYVRAAEQLAAGDGYTQRILDPEAPPTATAFYPVGFPALLAGLRLIGLGLRADLFVQALASSLTLVLTASLARRVAGPKIARVASWWAATSPGSVLLVGTWLAEPFVALGMVTAMHFALAPRARTSRWSMAAAGATLGLTAYLRATPLLVAPVVAAMVGMERRGGPKVAARYILITSLAALVPLVPWVARNIRALDSPVLVSTNGGSNLLIGTYGDGSFREIERPQRCGAFADEVALDRCRSAVAVARIAQRPWSRLARGAGKLWHTFGHDSASAQHYALATRSVGRAALDPMLLLGIARFHWMMLASFASVGFLARILRRPSRASAVLVAPVVALGALHCTYLGGDRYHAAVVPMLAILAAESCALALALHDLRPEPDTGAQDGRGV